MHRSTHRTMDRTTRPRLRALAVATTAGLLSAALGLSGLTSAGAAPAERPRAKNPNATEFAMKGWGFGTRIQGGAVPAESGATAHRIVACTNKVGQDKFNEVASVALPSLGTVSTVKTRVRTVRDGSTVGVVAQNTIGQITLSDSPLGTLLLDAVSTTAYAYHDGTSFGATTNTDLAKLQFQPPVGPPLTLELPRPDRPVEIPGFGSVELAHSWKPATANGARAFANGLKIRLYRTNTIIRVAHAAAVIGSDVKHGIFSGESYGLGGSAVANVIKLGKNPLLTMPCSGTAGQTKTRQLAGLDLAGQLVVSGAKSEQMADQDAKKAWGWERSSVGDINLGNGQLVINGIVGQVNVKRTGPKPKNLTRNANGTSIGSITVNGQVQELPLDQVIEIPGLAKLEPKVVTPLPNGIKVTALRITLLDGTGAVLELGNARLQIRKVAEPRKR